MVSGTVNDGARSPATLDVDSRSFILMQMRRRMRWVVYSWRCRTLPAVTLFTHDPAVSRSCRDQSAPTYNIRVSYSHSGSRSNDIRHRRLALWQSQFWVDKTTLRLCSVSSLLACSYVAEPSNNMFYQWFLFFFYLQFQALCPRCKNDNFGKKFRQNSHSLTTISNVTLESPDPKFLQ